MFKPIPKMMLNKTVTYNIIGTLDKWSNPVVVPAVKTLTNVMVVSVKSRSNSDMDSINIGVVKLIYDAKNSSGKTFDFNKGDVVVNGADEMKVLSVFEAKLGASVHHWELELG